MQSIGKSHLAKTMMMAITFAVGSNVHELWPGPLIRKTTQQSTGESLAIIEQSFKCHTLRDGAIVEKNIDGFARRKVHRVRPAWVNPVSAHVNPFAATLATHALGLPRSQYGEAYSMLCENLQ